MHYAYDAQSRQIWKSDAAGTEHQMIFSDGGRLFEDRVVAVGSAVDGTVRLRRYLYNTKGRLESVTQWDNATPGGGATPLDEAAFYFDDWGKLAVAQTDVDSGVGGAGEPTYEIDYEWHKAGPAGRRVVRPDSAEYPSGDRLEYRYNGADYNEELSRPNAMVMFAGGGTVGVTKSTSEYLGWGQLTTFAYSTTDIQMTIMGPPLPGPTSSKPTAPGLSGPGTPNSPGPRDKHETGGPTTPGSRVPGTPGPNGPALFEDILQFIGIG